MNIPAGAEVGAGAEVVPRSGGTPGGTFEGVPRNIVPLGKMKKINEKMK